MDKGLQQKLHDRFPKLYSELGQKDSCMFWGVTTGDGWFDLIWRLSEDLEKLDPNLVAIQVKEKFGTLSFYLRQADLGVKQYDQGMISFEPQARNEQVRARVKQATEESAVTCEQCGKPGKMRAGSWHAVRCDACQDALNAEHRKEFGAQWSQQHGQLVAEMDALGDAAKEIRESYSKAAAVLAAGDCTEDAFAGHVAHLLKRCQKAKQKGEKREL